MKERAKLRLAGNTNNFVMKRPIFVWEPIPDSCKPSAFQDCLEALRYVDVISPNLFELNSLFEEKTEADDQLDPATLKARCNKLLTLGFGVRPSAVVVRLGERGCYVAQLSRHIFLPAYHGSQNDCDKAEHKPWIEKVLDPTGGGNAFLGGLCIGLLNEPHPLGLTDFEVGALYGSVAASFAIEQIGMPTLSYHESDGRELWNGESVRDRLNTYVKRLEVPNLSEKELQRASLYKQHVDFTEDFIEEERRVRKNEFSASDQTEVDPSMGHQLKEWLLPRNNKRSLT